MDATTPPWAQPGITGVSAARRFLADLRAPDTLTMTSSDGDVGFMATGRAEAFRGHGVHVSRSVIAATPLPEDLVAYHRRLGLGPERVFCPGPTARARLAQLVLDDDALCDRLRADPSLERMLVACKDATAAALIARLGLTPSWCAPPAEVYETANDKLVFAEAATRWGFDAVPMRRAADPDDLATVFRDLAAVYGAGCILRLRRGAAGRGIHHARTLRAARRIWRRLHAQGDVLVASYVPPGIVVRNVATHGLVTEEGFVPILFSEQIIHRHQFRGGRVRFDWHPEEVAVVGRTLAGIARWLAEIGYVDAPAGIDGFLVRGTEGLRFLALDPNIRMTAMMRPWAAVAILSEAAGRRFVWQFEWCPMLGVPLTLSRLRRRLGGDLLDPAALERGGILPTFLDARGVGPFGVTGMWVLLLARDAAHLPHLHARVRGLALIRR